MSSNNILNKTQLQLKYLQPFNSVEMYESIHVFSDQLLQISLHMNQYGFACKFQNYVHDTCASMFLVCTHCMHLHKLWLVYIIMFITFYAMTKAFLPATEPQDMEIKYTAQR